MSEKRWSVATLTEAHSRLALDANVLIYLLEGIEPLGLPARRVLEAVESGALSDCLATVGQVEILSGPARHGETAVFEETAEELRSLPLRLVALDPDIAEDAAWIRGTEGVGLADALQFATARAAGATAFLTNDRRIRTRPGLEVIYLDEIEVASA